MTLSLLLILAGCSDNGLSRFRDSVVEPAPRIAVDPNLLDFGRVLAADQAELSVTVTNVGSGLLRLTDVQLPAELGFTLVSPATASLLSGESDDLLFRFQPRFAAQVSDVADLFSNDVVTPVLPVTLTGYGAVPELQIDPATYDFGPVVTGCTQSVRVTLRNVGVEPLTVSEALWTLPPGLAANDYPLPLTLGPTETTFVELTYTAGASAGPVEGTLVVASNDPRGERSGVYQGQLSPSDRAVETFSFDAPPPVDIVLAVDQSDSMTDDAVLLGAGLDAFATALSAQSTGWQLGVVTLDSGCFNGGILSSSTANLADIFADAVSLGDDAMVSDDEALLLLSERAVSLDVPNQCNAGLRRPDAPLHVIVVSDEPERSNEQASAFTWSFWVDQLQGYVSRPDRLVVHGVVDVDDCNEGADGYEQAIDLTGGVSESICATNWPEALASLANGITGGLYRLPLTGTPAPGSIEVTVDGEVVSASYDAATGELVLDEPVVTGAPIEVSYVPFAECSR